MHNGAGCFVYDFAKVHNGAGCSVYGFAKVHNGAGCFVYGFAKVHNGAGCFVYGFGEYAIEDLFVVHASACPVSVRFPDSLKAELHTLCALWPK